MKQGKLLIFLSLVNCYLARYDMFLSPKPPKNRILPIPASITCARHTTVCPAAAKPAGNKKTKSGYFMTRYILTFY